MCSCPPFECSCNKGSPLPSNFSSLPLGRSPLAANTPHYENYSPGVDSYSHMPTMVDGFTAPTWTSTADWTSASAAPYKTDQSWVSWNMQANTPLNSEVFGQSSALENPLMPSANQIAAQDRVVDPLSNSHVITHLQQPLPCGPTEEESDCLLSLDSFQPSDIFALDNTSYSASENVVHPNFSSDGNILLNSKDSRLGYENFNQPLSCSQQPAEPDMDAAATKFLQCLDDIIGDCLLDENEQNVTRGTLHYDGSNSSRYNSLQFQDNTINITSCSNPLAPAMSGSTTPLENNNSSDCVYVGNKQTYACDFNQALPMHDAVQAANQFCPFIPIEGSTSQLPCNNNSNRSSPVTLKVLNNFEQPSSIPLCASQFTLSSETASATSPQSVIPSPPTFQNLDTLETTQVSPISSLKYEQCPPLNASTILYPSSNHFSTPYPDFSSHNPSMQFPSSDAVVTSSYSLPERGPFVTSSSSYDVTMYTSSFPLDDTQPKSFNAESHNKLSPIAVESVNNVNTCVK